MMAGSLGARGRGRRSRAVAGAAAFAAALAAATPAFAAWSGGTSGSCVTRAKTLAAGNTPEVTIVKIKGLRYARLTWAAAQYVEGGAAAAGYRIRRFNATTGLGFDATGECAGVVTALTCDEGVPGSWRYSVTPVAGGWVGNESSRSAPIIV